MSNHGLLLDGPERIDFDLCQKITIGDTFSGNWLDTRRWSIEEGDWVVNGGAQSNISGAVVESKITVLVDKEGQFFVSGFLDSVDFPTSPTAINTVQIVLNYEGGKTTSVSFYGDTDTPPGGPYYVIDNDGVIGNIAATDWTDIPFSIKRGFAADVSVTINNSPYVNATISEKLESIDFILTRDAADDPHTGRLKDFVVEDENWEPLYIITGSETAMLDEGRQRMLYQFKNSCVLDQLLQVPSCESQELMDTLCDFLSLRLLPDARGKQLEVIGQIVGQSKIGNTDEDTGPWIGPDSDEEPIGVPDVGMNWLAGQQETTFDKVYMNQIVAKIHKNHVKYASYPEVVRYIKLITGFDVSFKRVGLLDAEMIVPDDATDSDIEFMMSFTSLTQNIENKYLMPIAATTRIIGARRRQASTAWFGPDKAATAPDIGLTSVTGAVT